MNMDRKQELLSALEQFGDPQQTPFGHWERDNGYNYVEQLKLCREDAPALMEIAQTWYDRITKEQWAEPEGYAPIHAWRAAAQLRNADVMDAYIEMLDPLATTDDDWLHEDFHKICAAMGPGVFPAVAAFLREESHEEWALVTAEIGLGELGKTYPELRSDAVAALTEIVERHERAPLEVTTFAIDQLLELRAVESAEPIERAFAADHVDVTVFGNWSQVKAKLGVEGLGLVPEELANKPISLFGSFPSIGSPEHPQPSASLRPPAKQKKNKRTKKRKNARKARKRNRRK